MEKISVTFQSQAAILTSKVSPRKPLFDIVDTSIFYYFYLFRKNFMKERKIFVSLGGKTIIFYSTCNDFLVALRMSKFLPKVIKLILPK
jgi:hypothetical protein